RNGNLEKCLQRIGSVNLCSFINRILDILQTCQIEYHVITSASPDQSDDNNRSRGPGIAEPHNGRQTDVSQNGVDKTVIGEHGTENPGVRYQGCCTGKENRCTEQSLESQMLVIKHRGKSHAEDQHDGNLNDQVKKCIE